MNKLLSILSKYNEFRVDFSCVIDKSFRISNYDPNIYRSGIKVDTGAAGTLIPLKTLGYTDIEILQLIDSVIKTDKSRLSVVRGVETNNTLHNSQIRSASDSFIKSFKGLAINMQINDFTINGINLGNIEARVTTQTTGNILLGMDIMKDWDIHIGKDINTHETLFLACPYNSINDEYLTALENHFGIGTIVNSALVRKSKIWILYLKCKNY